MDMIHQESMENILMKSAARLSHLDVLMEAIIGKAHRHQAAAQYPAESMGSMVDTRIKTVMRKKNDCVTNPLLKSISSSKAPDDVYIARSGPFLWNRRKKRKAAPCSKGRKSKNAQFFFSSLVFLENEN